jgi:cupin 2 domain-containing protein
MPGDGGNLLAALPARLDAEQIIVLLEYENLRIERIVSTGQASPPGFWYDQPWAEWVLVSRFRSSPELAARADANFGIEGH